ncbi:MAG TPA: hypothetical protein VKA84_18760, partial [Gemmatimonadaceae bacterium]|nr:hypothetical protein [Gemmatimonadaceae bacterium]
DGAAVALGPALSAAALVDSTLPRAAAPDPVRAASPLPPLPSLAPTVDGARVAVRAPAPMPATAAAPMRARGGLQNSQVLMIIGGSAVLLGLLVDNDASDVLIIAGAGVGLWGLYQYLKTNQ